MSRLEILPNELLLYIFKYSNCVHLIHTFFGLNARFDHLLYIHLRDHSLNFQSIQKEDFDIIYQKHLPLLSDYIISLHLPSDDETPNLCEHFLSHRFTLDRFINLKSLSLYHVDSPDTIKAIIRQCGRLLDLNRLTLIDCRADYWTTRISINMINDIWRFRKLTHCTINDIKLDDKCLSEISVISSSIEYLFIAGVKGDINSLDCLFKFTPQLRRLTMKDTDQMKKSHHRVVVLPLISFKTLIGDGHLLIDLLQCMSNLYYLTLESFDILMNGHDWEKLIVNYVAKLKVFRLKMTNSFKYNDNIYEKTDVLVDSFRTDFWVEQHQWYVRCDCYYSNQRTVGTLYTLPYTLNEYSYLNCLYSKSTKPDDEDIFSCSRVEYSGKKNIIDDSFHNPSLIKSAPSNILRFKVTFPFRDFFDSYNVSSNGLTSLTVELNNVMDYHQLQRLLNQMHNLYSLKLDSFGGSPKGIFKLTSSSVRRLDLMKAQKNDGNFFNDDDYINLINSPLGQQCEVLLINIEHRRNILDLIEKIPHLRVLSFRYMDIIFNHNGYPTIQKNFLRWLKENFPSKSSIVRDENHSSMFCVWIYRKTNRSLSNNSSYLTWTNINRLFYGFFPSIRRVFTLDFSDSAE